MFKLSSNKKIVLLTITGILIAILLSQTQSWKFSSKDRDTNNLIAPKVKTIPILMYHYVEYVTDENDFIRSSLNIEPHVFEQQLITLKEAGYMFITPKDLPEIMKENSEEKYVIISFDDGYGDFYTDAFPILQKHNVPAINYVVPGFLGNLNYLTTEQLRTIAQSNLIEIGAHTMNHIHLTSVEKDTAYWEIEKSKKTLEEILNIEIVAFAYPYGTFNDSLANVVEKAGFTTAVTVDKGNKINSSDLFKIKRVRPGVNTGKDLIYVIENPTP